MNHAVDAGAQSRPDTGAAGTTAPDASLPLLPRSAAGSGSDALAVCERPRMLISFGGQVEAVCFDVSQFANSGSLPLDDAGADGCPTADALAWPSIGERCGYLPVCDDVLSQGRPARGTASAKACCYWVQQVCGV